MLGFIFPDTSTLPTTTQTTQAKPKDGSAFANIANGISSIFNSAAPVVQAVVKPNTPGVPGYSNLPSSSPLNPPPPPASAPAKSNALKYGIIAVATLGVGALVYKLTKKKKSLGTTGLQPYNGGLGSAKKKTRKRKK